MKTIALAVAVALAGGTAAVAQTTPSPSQSPSSQPSTTMPDTTSTPKTPEAPGTTKQPSSGMTTGSTTPGAPLPGANSFTESQARSRLESNGFKGVTNLQKDANGVWQGTATKDGKQQTVSLDYQGNIVAK
jgi:putative membrane protein